MREKMTKANRFDELQEPRAKKFQTDNNLDTEEMSMVDAMATTTAVMHRLMFILNHASNEVRKGFGQKLFKLKEEIDAAFPTSKDDGTSIDEMCPLCAFGDEGNCTHKNHIRAAILLCAMFRIHPKVDLDEPEDEIPDTNEGMVES